MKIQLPLLSILLGLQLLFSQASPHALFRRCRDAICIYYTSDDERFVDETLAILLQARDEISRDLFYAHPDTLRVIIAPSRREFRDYLRGQLPEWTQAFAVPATGTMVVRSPRWDRPESSYRQSLAHELLHLLLHQHIGNRELPRWLEEGMAIFYAEHADYENKTLLSRAMATGSLIPLQEIDKVLQFQRGRAELAYQQSYSSVRYLLATYDVEGLRAILDGIAKGEDLDRVFVNATGSTLSGFEEEWHLYLDKTERWLWLTQSDELLWLALPLFFLIVVFLVRRRNRRRIAEWEAAQAWQAAGEEYEGETGAAADAVDLEEALAGECLEAHEDDGCRQPLGSNPLDDKSLPAPVSPAEADEDQPPADLADEDERIKC